MNNLKSINQVVPHQKTSAKYKFVNTAEILRRFMALGWVITKATETNSKVYDGYQKHMVRLHHPDIGNKEYRPEIILINGHHASTALVIMLGIFRFVCENGMIVGEELVGAKIRHTGFTYEKLEEAIGQMLVQIDKLNNMITMMRQTRLSHPEMLRFAREAVTKRLGNVEGEIDFEPAEIIRPTRYEDHSDNLWVFYNLLQEKLLKGGIKYSVTKPLLDVGGGYELAKSRNNTTREVRAIDQQVELNTWLFSKAFELAA